MVQEPNALVMWLLARIEGSNRYRSARSLSIAAGLAPNTVGTILERGQGTAETIAKIARALGVSVMEALVAAGVVSRDEADLKLTEGEEDFLTLYRALPEEAQGLWLQVGRRFQESADD